MTPEIKRKIVKKILGNLLILLVILVLIIAVTGIPMDFDIVSYRGEYKPNMETKKILESIKGNFKMFFSGKALGLYIQGSYLWQLFARTAGKSFIILFFGAILALILGVLKGIIDSRKNHRIGTVKLLQSLIPLSLPDVLTVVLVQMGAMYLFKNEISIFGIGPFPYYGNESLAHAIFPIIAISILPAAYISRITANEIEEGFTKPYILAARGKGCSRLQIIKNHMMRSIFYGVLSGFPSVLGIMFSSLIIVERLFQYKGMGFYLIYFQTTRLIRPYEGGTAFTFFIAMLAIFYYFIFILLNLLKDILLPRIKSQ